MSRNHIQRISAEWKSLLSTLEQGNSIDIDGNSLDISKLIAVARYGSSGSVENIPQQVAERVDQSVQFLRQELDKGHSVYGVTTGFGGSADTSTTATETLQVGLLQMQLSAVLPVAQPPQGSVSGARVATVDGNAYSTLSVPEPWVRGAMLVRCNSLLRGHSAVRLDVIKTLLALLKNDMVPVVPLRGSISASGDLCPLSYIAGSLEGNPDVYVWTGPKQDRKPIASDLALRQLGLTPITFGPKETLGILNGTAMSASVATLAQYQADNLMLLSQILTSMGAEALQGRFDSFDPFIAEVRPHRGQKEVAQNITSFLNGSLLARGGEHEIFVPGNLRQDRYALRTASQWLGPYVEDLGLAREQLEVELNSTTDNPLLDISERKVHHAGNFQAVAITSSTEKVRLALQMIGKMVFAQSSELLNVHMNNGLPPNLAADEPSLSYTLKGVDINMAAYMSELKFLANPVSSHVETAEMANQSLNSLALISTRYTHMALDVLSLMLSAYLYSLCQALDLRVMQDRFIQQLKPAFNLLTIEIFAEHLVPGMLDVLQHSVWTAVETSISTTTTLDSSNRFVSVAESTHTPLLSILATSPNADAITLINAFTSRIAALCKSTFLANRTSYLSNPDATPSLGMAAKKLYTFVRKGLGVPLHKGLLDHPVSDFKTGASPKHGDKKRTTGTWISVIYQAIRDDRIVKPIMACAREALEGEKDVRAKL